MTIKLLDFEQALKKADNTYGKKHLVLGNGFSMACKPDIFAHHMPAGLAWSKQEVGLN